MMKNIVPSFYFAGAVTFAMACACAVAQPAVSVAAPTGSNCLKLHGMPGPEDLALSRSKKWLYVSSHNRRHVEETGKLFAVDLSKPDAELKPQALRVQYPPHFKPHGISLVEQGGQQRLYVISHPLLAGEGEKHTIEIFEGAELNFTHVKTLKSPLLDSPNDVQAMPDGRIFVSNDHSAAGGARRWWDDAMRSKTSRISYFDGKDWSYIGRPVAGGNGVLVNMESGKEYLYRSAFFENAVVKYEIVKTEQGVTDLQEVARINVEHGPDNLELDEQGRLLVAVHPSVLRFLMHLASGSQKSPSQIMKINLANQQVEKVFADDGGKISAASTAVVSDKRMILSQVFEDFVLVCPR